jgi:hypothetical protein
VHEKLFARDAMRVGSAYKMRSQTTEDVIGRGGGGGGGPDIIE